MLERSSMFYCGALSFLPRTYTDPTSTNKFANQIEKWTLACWSPALASWHDWKKSWLSWTATATVRSPGSSSFVADRLFALPARRRSFISRSTCSFANWQYACSIDVPDDVAWCFKASSDASPNSSRGEIDDKPEMRVIFEIFTSTGYVFSIVKMND